MRFIAEVAVAFPVPNTDEERARIDAEAQLVERELRFLLQRYRLRRNPGARRRIVSVTVWMDAQPAPDLPLGPS
jgi:hypothetical protein